MIKKLKEIYLIVKAIFLWSIFTFLMLIEWMINKLFER